VTPNQRLQATMNVDWPEYPTSVATSEKGNALDVR